MPLVLGAAYVTTATLSNFVGALLLDRVGRKPLFSMLPHLSHKRPEFKMYAHTNGVSRWIDWLYAFRDSRNNYDCAILWDHRTCRPFDGGFFLLLFYIFLWWWH
jgi:hypothetical protein